MRRDLLIRNVVCPEANPSGFDVNAFKAALDLGDGENMMRVNNVSISEWEKFRLQILPDRLQLGFKPPAESDLVRQVTEAFLSGRDQLGSGAKVVGANAAVQLTLEDGDGDPSQNIINAQAMAEALGGGEGARAGLTLVYRDDFSRWWIELTPQPDTDGQWAFDFNRQFETFPEAGEQRDAILDWFADVEADLFSRFETICGGGN